MRCQRAPCVGSILDPDDGLGARCNLCGRRPGENALAVAALRAMGVKYWDSKVERTGIRGRETGTPTSSFHLGGKGGHHYRDHVQGRG